MTGLIFHSYTDFEIDDSLIVSVDETIGDYRCVLNLRDGSSCNADGKYEDISKYVFGDSFREDIVTYILRWTGVSPFTGRRATIYPVTYTENDESHYGKWSLFIWAVKMLLVKRD